MRDRKRQGPEADTAPKVRGKRFRNYVAMFLADMAGRLESSYADLKQKLDIRTKELSEALERETATSEVLGVISSSPSNLEPVFEAMLANATRLCEASYGTLWLCEGDAIRAVALHGAVPDAYAAEVRRRTVSRLDPVVAVARAARTGQTVHVAHLRTGQAYLDRHPLAVAAVELSGIRTLIDVPMLKQNEVVGVMSIYRREDRPFSEKQIALVTNFAKQAVIAIENARLLNELRQSLEQQTATSDVLNVISRSPTDAQPVFQIIGERAERLCEAEVSVVSMVEGELIQLAFLHGVAEGGAEAVRRAFPMHRNDETVTARAIRTCAVVHVPDVLADPQYEQKDAARAGDYRSCLGVPMVRGGAVIGAIFVARREPGFFADAQVELLKTFADQAVIAIENVRLFDEVQARTRELTESLEYQTAISDVLKVISRSRFDLQPVLETVAETAARLCDAAYGAIFRRDGDVYRVGTAIGFSPEASAAARHFREFLEGNPLVPGRGSVTGRVAMEGRAVHIADSASDPEYTVAEATTLGKLRTQLGVPMLRDGSLIGVIVLARHRVEPFTEKQIELVTTFANQAVIAIENARVLNELRESLEQQTATSEVLGIISSSPSELGPVFETILANATRLCEASYGTLWLCEGEAFRAVALHGPVPTAFAAERRGGMIRPPPGGSDDNLHRPEGIHHPARRCGGRVAARRTRAAAGDAGDRLPKQRAASGVRAHD